MADIHALELEFAKNPTLEACIPLCEAYLGQKRFMEAMVVCKKGIKGAPQEPRGRVMLARIYLEQGKVPKAQQELETMLAEMPGNPLGLELFGKVLLDQGRRDEAVQSWQRALATDPSLPNARAWLGQLGIAGPAAAAPMPAAAPAMPQPGFQPTPVQFGGQPMAQPGFGQPMPQPGFQPVPQMPPQQPMMAPPAQPNAFQGGFAMPQPGMQPPMGAPAPAPAAAPAPAGDAGHRPLEHVSDFFASDTLGFSNDNSAIETAGPGRLTILGFVPKSTGSIKTTLFITIGVFAVAGAFIAWQYKKSQDTRVINKLYGEIDSAMREDNLARYQFAIKKGEEALAVDDSHPNTLAALAYASAVLATDYKQDGALAKAKDYLKRAEEASETPLSLSVAARALIAYGEKQYDQGIADAKKVIDAKGSSPLFELEAFRLMDAAKPEDKETQLQLRRLTGSVTSEARIYAFLGWYYYSRDDWALADKNFNAALQNQRTHAPSLIGSALVDLGRGMALQERQKEVEQNLKKVLALPPEELGQELLAVAHFARGQLLKWQGNDAGAEEAYKEAAKIDPENSMFAYRRGTALLKLGEAAPAVEFLKKAAAKEPNNARYYKTLAQAQIKAKDFTGAAATLERATQLASTDYELKLLEGERLVADKKFPEAITAYKKLTRDDGPVAFSLAAIGVSTALRESGKKPEAVKQIKDFLANAPANIDGPTLAKVWGELGLDLEATREKDAAIEAYQSGIDSFRYYPDIHYFLCRAFGGGDEAKEACKTYLALDPRGQYAADAKKRSGQ